jgi:hypothetical protein
MSSRQVPILINPINRAKPRPPRDPYSALRHRYNYPLMYKGDYQPELIGPIYIDKYNMEYADAEDFIKTNMRDFVETRELRSRDIIMELIGINRFKRDLVSDTFFVIDYDFLMMKFKLIKGGSPSKALKINTLINNVLLPSYKAIWCIQDTLKIARDLFVRTPLGTNKQEPVKSILDIIIDEDLIEEVEIEDELVTFSAMWEDDESALVIPEGITITPLMVIEYYVDKLNKLMVKLHYYKISINETIIKSINQGLKSLNNTIKVIYKYDPQWIINVEDTKKTRSLTIKKSKRSFKRTSKRLTKSL